ncbi:hypothetical protein MIND_01327800 [Mycena indigotica]|uniref:Uncharacterized protein n=1 Tax=Mycena indigotica TaxID=2126181 RepID=A0A8H6VS95_9AGAR|nr:uncharacterized protein MIND_01327800 [Mycena indigotica]KAF7290146.1 hypothetical protein MIND_01327800 [Mycena indigotica]
MQARNATSGSGFNVAPHTNNAQTLNAQDRMALRQEAETIDTTIAALRARIIELKIRKKCNVNQSRPLASFACSSRGTRARRWMQLQRLPKQYCFSTNRITFLDDIASPWRELIYKGEDSILECLSRSSGNITSLSLTNIAYPVFRLFLENPVISEALEDLTVTLLPMTHRENEALTIFLSRTNFLPRLESLTLGTPTAAGRGPSPTLRAIVDGLGQRVLVATSHNRRHEIILCTVSSTSTLL